MAILNSLFKFSPETLTYLFAMSVGIQIVVFCVAIGCASHKLNLVAGLVCSVAAIGTTQWLLNVTPIIIGFVLALGVCEFLFWIANTLSLQNTENIWPV